jgi:hypothetical protein
MTFFQNKWLLGTLRTLLALLLLFAGGAGLYGLLSGAGYGPSEPADLALAFQGLAVSGILLVVKAFEVVIGLLLLVNFRPALAAILLAPLSVGMVVWHLALAPATIGGAAFVALVNAYLGYVYLDRYRAIFAK